MADAGIPFVPADFVIPTRLHTEDFELVPLGPEHNERDYAAWTSSIEHILATPGFAGWGWPHEMPLEENRDDLVRHAADFAAGRGFTYTVLAGRGPDPGQDVIGCVYIYPLQPTEDGRPTPGARVRSWVRADRAELDVALWEAVSAWLDSSWPFTSVEYAPR